MAEHIRIRAVVIDPYPVWGEGISSFLSRGGYVILGQARDFEGGLRQLRSLHPNLVVLGPHLGQRQCLALCREITRRWPGIHIILIAEEAQDPQFLIDAVSAGAAACLPGEVEADKLLAVVEAVTAGRAQFSGEVLAQASQPITLTAREQQVLQLMAEGRTDREVAAALGLAVSTIRNHSQRLLEKLGVHSRAEAVRRARRRGWI